MMMGMIRNVWVFVLFVCSVSSGYLGFFGEGLTSANTLCCDLFVCMYDI
jgi:hypothetical protein